MFKYLMFIALTLSVVPMAHADDENAIWNETGLSTKLITQTHPLFTSENCRTDLIQFQGCISALEQLASMATPALTLLPDLDSIADSSFLPHGALVKSFGFYKLYLEVDEETTNKGMSFFAMMQKHLQKYEAHMATNELFFKSSELNNFSYNEVFAYLLQHINPKKHSDASVAAAALNAFLRIVVDPHARIQSRKALAKATAHGQEEIEGGIGVSFFVAKDGFFIHEVYSNTPAKAAGVHSNDQVIELNGQSVKNKTRKDFGDLVTGPIGSKLKMVVRRDGKKETLTITRGHIAIPDVRSEIIQTPERRIGRIFIKTFIDKKTCSLVAKEIKQLTAERVTSWILDLRENPGGILDAAVCTAGLFLGPKLVVSTQSLDNENSFIQHTTPYEHPYQALTTLPMVVLINGSSASAAEIVSGALQAHGRAWVIGERSFGKGSVQEAEPFVNDEILLFKTVHRFYLPDGRSNQIVGVQPNFVVPFKPEATEEERYVPREKDYFPNGLPEKGSEVWKETRPLEASKLKTCVEGPVSSAKTTYLTETAQNHFADYQLYYAEDVLSCMATVK